VSEGTGANQDLKMAEARFRQARTMVRYNRSAEFPTIGVGPNIQSLRYSPNQPYFPANVGTSARGAFTLPFDLSYEVDLWGPNPPVCHFCRRGGAGYCRRSCDRLP